MAELIAASTALGVVSSLITFGDVAWRLIKRFQEFSENSEDIPKVVRKISNQLPVLHDAISQWKQDTGEGVVIIDDGSAAISAIIGCSEVIISLQSLIDKIVPTKSESKVSRMRKALKSMKYESNISKLWTEVESYERTLTFYFTHRGPSIQKEPAGGKEIPQKQLTSTQFYYNYPNRLVRHYMDRSLDGIPLTEQIDDYFNAKGEISSQPRVAVLLGMGGAGKSQLTLRYCEKVKRDGKRKAILWVDASSSSSIAQSFEEILCILTGSKTYANRPTIDSLSTYPSAQTDPAPQCVEAVKRAIQELPFPWLLVFDNFDRPDELKLYEKYKSIRDYWPQSGNGAVLLTSRHRDCERLGKAFEVGKMSEVEGSSLLLSLTMDEVVETTITMAKEVANLLGCLALAIDQAGAYIRAQNLHIAQYPIHYKERKEKVLKYIPEGSTWDYQRHVDGKVEETALSVFTTWDMSLECISGDEVERDMKRSFLSVAAFLSPFNILEDVFRQYITKCQVTPSWAPLFCSRGEWDSFEFGDVVTELKGLSLVESYDRSDRGSRFSLHPLVSDWIKLRLSTSLQDSYAKESIILLRNNLPKDHREDNDGRTVEDLQLLLPHLSQCLVNCTEFLGHNSHLGISDLEEPGFCFLRFLQDWHMLDEAEKICVSILNWREAKQLSWTTVFLEVGLRLTWVYRGKRNFEKVRSLAPMILSECDRMIATDTDLKLRCLSSVGLMFKDSGRFGEAEKTLQDCYARQRSLLGPRHQHTIATQSNLANLYALTEHAPEAIRNAEMALESFRATKGPNYVSALETQDSLISIYIEAGKFDKALPLTIDCISRLKARLGPSHSNTTRAYLRLAQIYQRTERLDDAEHLLFMVSKVLDALGNADPKRKIELYHEFGRFYWLQNKHDMAMVQFEKAITGYRQINECHSLEALRCLVLLSGIYKRRSEYQKAGTLWDEAIVSYHAAGDKRYDVEKSIYWGRYWLFAERAFYEDSSLKPKVKEMLDAAIFASLRLLQPRATIAPLLRNAQTGYCHLEEYELVDKYSCKLLMLWDEEIKAGHQAPSCDGDTYLQAVETPLPSFIVTLCNALLDWHYYPDKRIIALAMVALHSGDITNAQIALELLIPRTTFAQNGHNPFMTCNICLPKTGTTIAGKFFVCSVCPDVDLDNDCYAMYTALESPIIGEGTLPGGCLGHKFLEIPRPEWIKWDNETVDGDGQTLTQWLVAMREIYKEKEIPDHLLESIALLDTLT